MIGKAIMAAWHVIVLAAGVTCIWIGQAGQPYYCQQESVWAMMGGAILGGHAIYALSRLAGGHDEWTDE